MLNEENEKRNLETEIINETILLCTQFLLTNSSDIELSKKSGKSAATIGRRLTNEENIKIAYDKVIENLKTAGVNENEIPKDGTALYELICKKRQENSMRGKTLGALKSYLNQVYVKDDGEIYNKSFISLEKIYRNTENQHKFLVHIALYFRLHLESLSELFQIDEKNLLEMLKVSPSAESALKVLFYHDGKDQNLAKSNFLNYYNSLIDAINSKDNDKKKQLIDLVTDAKAVSIHKNKIAGQTLSDESIGILLRYQIKYSLRVEDICDIFNVSMRNYLKRINKYLEDKDELRGEYEYLTDYLQARSRYGGRRG